MYGWPEFVVYGETFGPAACPQRSSERLRGNNVLKLPAQIGGLLELHACASSRAADGPWTKTALNNADACRRHRPPQSPLFGLVLAPPRITTAHPHSLMASRVENDRGPAR
jgi:hypothetical protein